MKVLAIDPGASGAIATMGTDWLATTYGESSRSIDGDFANR